MEADDGGTLQTECDVQCPHCGEVVTLGLDPGGGGHQDYIEDCQVCCRPWRVIVRYDSEGWVSVRVEPSS